MLFLTKAISLQDRRQVCFWFGGEHIFGCVGAVSTKHLNCCSGAINWNAQKSLWKIKKNPWRKIEQSRVLASVFRPKLVLQLLLLLVYTVNKIEYKVHTACKPRSEKLNEETFIVNVENDLKELELQYIPLVLKTVKKISMI